MNIEQLKVIAEGMGYGTSTSNDDSMLFCITGKMLSKGDRVFPETYVYNPLTNNDQMVEIMEKLKISLWFDGVTWIAELKNGPRYAGMTINEAVCLAAYEYFKDK